METLAILIMLFASGFIIRRILVKFDKEQELRDKEHAILMQIQRNEQVKYFRLRLLNEFDAGIVKCMPTYREMLESDKPLIAKEWVRIDELVNLN